MFVNRYMGLTLIAVYLVIWLFLNVPLGRKGLDETAVDESVSSPIEIIGSEIDRTSEDFIPRSLAGVELGRPVEELESDPAWEEWAEEERGLMGSELRADERLFGSLNRNLTVSTREDVVCKISFAHPKDAQLDMLIEKIHGHYGTAEDPESEWIVWEDENARLDFISREQMVNLVLTEKD
jgi:hypothetical protein